MTLWILGGLDPTGGAGVLRDWATARAIDPALRVRVVVTAWTQQGHGEPASAWPVDGGSIERQLGAGPPPGAIKVGAVPPGSVAAVARFLERADCPIVVDPVLRATDGGQIGAEPRRLEAVLKHATLITPNLDEATQLADDEPALHAKYPAAGFLFKNTPTEDPQGVADTLVLDGSREVFTRKRHGAPDPRGTGCALATAIAVGLARGQPLAEAAQAAIAWLDARRRSASPVEGDGYFLS